MGFNIQKFRDAKIKPRTRDIEIKELACFFDDDENPIFKIKNLTGHEIAECNEAVKSNQQVRVMVEKLLSSNAREKADAICESLGVGSNKTPDDLVRRINILRVGSVDPVLNNEDCVRLASMFPEQFYDLTNNILILTHMGAELGE
jgi:hypothetical protein